jgi:peroxiredoxin
LFNLKIIFYKYIIIILLILSTSDTSYGQKKYLLTAYLILNTECPISQNIIQVINDLKIKYNTVDFKSVFTAWDNKMQIQHFKKKYKLHTDIIHDQKHKLIMHFGASKTPEVFLINNKKLIIYQGAINNQYLALGARKSTDITCYLEEAIKEYLAKGIVKIAKTNVVGCKIESVKKL